VANPEARVVSQIIHNFGYHPPKTEDTVVLHEGIRNSICGLALEMNTVLPQGREAAIVQTKLEEAMFWANAAIARETE
jgi:hypothetical protein